MQLLMWKKDDLIRQKQEQLEKEKVRNQKIKSMVKDLQENKKLVTESIAGKEELINKSKDELKQTMAHQEELKRQLEDPKK